MNSDKLNMYAAAIIGSTLVFLLLHFLSGQVFGTRGHHGHEPLAFAVEIEDAGAGGGEPAAVDWAGLVAAADVADGENAFKKCTACHKLEDGANGVGPHLWGVVGRDIASVAGFDYSAALADLEGDWTLESLAGFLADPKGYAPGTKMTFAGLKKPEDQVALIVYLNEADGTPIELATAPAQTEVAAASTETQSESGSEGTASSEGTTEETAAASTEETATASTESSTESQAEPTTETATETQQDSTTEVAAASGAFPAGDAEAGAKVFRKCRACHKVEEGAKGVGPSLWGIVGRDKASVEGFKYSDAMAAAEGNWTASELDAFLANPKATVPGNRMTFPGLKKDEDRVNVIHYLNEADGTPDPLN